MKNILIATIGTRDLMFQISAGEWYNVGDDQMQDGEIIGEQAEVLADLGFAQASFRGLTQYFLENLEQYRSRLRPVIIGKLLADQAQNLERIYLIGTDQKIGISLNASCCARNPAVIGNFKKVSRVLLIHPVLIAGL